MKKSKFQPKDYIALAIIVSLTIIISLGYDSYLKAGLLGVALAYGDIILPKIGR